MRVTRLGVALDWQVADGLAFLIEHGPFDQVAAGGNWLNIGAVSLLWRDLPGQPAIPQIVIYRRSLIVDDAGITLEADTVLARIVGVGEIIAWIDRGAPVLRRHMTGDSMGARAPLIQQGAPSLADLRAYSAATVR